MPSKLHRSISTISAAGHPGDLGNTSNAGIVARIEATRLAWNSAESNDRDAIETLSGWCSNQIVALDGLQHAPHRAERPAARVRRH